ncbi:MAG TPA: MogA/MoaB family molybdenum cofactor biosynthesis protein [Ktedonobacterales bacterium]|nr:MogA/MoaB family molybdenum cofactor biosynthesis protein [Ktedonobacterales bacterium]
MRIGVLTISTSLARGERAADDSGDAIVAITTAAPLRGEIIQRAVIADDQEVIAATLREWADAGTVDLLLTTGGTGLAPTDVTPEATLAVLDRVAAGLAEAMRAQTAVKTPLAWLSRGVAGTRKRTLIVNLPGSPKAVRECLEVLSPILPHAIDILTQQVRQHDQQS